MGSFLDYLSGGKKEASPTDFSSLSNYYNPDYDQRMEDNKRRAQAIGGIIDGLRHLGNLTYTSQGASPMQLGNTGDVIEKKYQTDMQRKLAYDKLMREQANDIFNRNLKIAGYQATQDYRDKIAKQKEAELARQKELDKAKDKQYQQRLDLEQKKLDRLKEVDTQRQRNAKKNTELRQQQINSTNRHYKAMEGIARDRANKDDKTRSITFSNGDKNETYTLNYKQIDNVAKLKEGMLKYANENRNNLKIPPSDQNAYRILYEQLKAAGTPLEIFNIMQSSLDRFPNQKEEFKKLIGDATKSQNGPVQELDEKKRNAFNTLTKD